MKQVTCDLYSFSPYSQSRYYSVEKLPKELPKDYEARTWRERLHANEDGEVFIPPMALKNCLSEVAKFLSIQIPGKGKSTYTKHFEAGVMAVEPVMLGIQKDDVLPEWLFVPSDGRRGGTTRVEKCFPIIHNWTGTASFLVLDETITHDVFIQHLKEAGDFIGLGRFRPRNNGFYGRFRVKQVTWDGEVVYSKGSESDASNSFYSTHASSRFT